MRLRIAILVFSLSCFALVATGLFQLVGPRREIGSRYARGTPGVGVEIDRQGVEFRYSEGASSDRTRAAKRFQAERDERAFGFERVTVLPDSYLSGDSAATHFVRVPLWAVDVLLALTIAASFVWVRRTARRAQRRLRNECLACGYDLRATPGRCPECGWKSVPAAHTASHA